MKADTATTIRIFVQVAKDDQRKLEFDHEQVTGREIKQAAEVPLETDLALKREGELVLVTDDQTITIKNGDHFIVLPLGTIS